MAKKQKPAEPVSSEVERRKSEKFYVTTPIYYVNADPHLGHVYTDVATDALARWHRLVGDDTFFLTGTDENSLKLVKAAEREKTTPQELADKYAARFEAVTKTFNLSNDEFIRTTDQQKHFPGAIKLWEKMRDAGYIYKGQHEGSYCIDCEQFYTEKELVDGKCPIHKTTPQQRSEENYLFKLSAFQEPLKKLIGDGTYDVFPENKRNEILSFLDGEVRDVSFSRPVEKLAMGVPVPGDDSQVMYVWCDALANYISAIGYGRDDQLFEQWWPADLHVIGKEISRFHAVYWPAMLMAADLPLPKRLFVHGFFTMEGDKMSKSLGNVIDPFELAKSHGVDAVRYYLLTALPHDTDGNYSEHRFKEVYDSELANDLGNLTSRVLALVASGYDGKVPTGKPDQELKEHVGQTHHRLAELLDQCKLAEALGALHDLVSAANRFVDSQKVWEQAGKAKESSLYTLVQVLGHLSVLYKPFIPTVAATMQGRLGLADQTWDAASLLEWEKIKPDTKISKGEPLFPKA